MDNIDGVRVEKLIKRVRLLERMMPEIEVGSAPFGEIIQMLDMDGDSQDRELDNFSFYFRAMAHNMHEDAMEILKEMGVSLDG